jgi:perosamine synthetase
VPSNDTVIPHSRPTVGPDDIRAVTEVMLSGQLAQGEKVRQFEEDLAAYLGRRGGVATNSGTSALHLALLALGLGAGDEVLLPSYTCVALLHAVRCVGATPRLVDIEPEGYNLCAEEARRCLTPQVKAVIIPHMFGMAADLTALASLGIPLIEDCAQALGGTYRGRRIGSVGTITICSFYATKMITTGEGGMLLSDTDVVLRRARDLRDYDGRTTLETRFNYKMTDMQAALGLSQLHQLPAFLERRRALASRYSTALQMLPIKLPAAKPDRAHAFYRYVVGVGDSARMARRLSRRGVQCKAPVFRPLHGYLEQKGFRYTETAMRTALSIPLYPSLAEEDVQTLLGAIAEEAQGEEERPRASSSHF